MNNPLINPGPGTFFWMLLSFAILVFILGKWGWPMVLKSLKKREEEIADSLSAAEKAREEMRLLKAGNEELLQQAKREREEMLLSARMARDQVIEEAKATATEEARRIIENARESITYEKIKALHELRNEIGNISIEIAEKLLRRELADKERANALIEEELDRIHLN
ncbi:MAG: F-type H+-transporting ATPase subunit b [bacterium P3]|nr:MAG: F-type H+-transporting ATPase subunit b [bacterium P3]KWW40388.1 MAG: F-type H+-transporting ATPase subunit b [bacterium F083]